MLKIRVFVPLLVLVFSLVSMTVLASAHEDREIGEFEVEVGFLNEPPFEAQPNGAFIKISKPGIDILTHGALFSSGTVDPGSNFEFEFDHELEDLEIQFHDHLTGEGGTVTVAHDAEVSGTQMIQFDGTFSPSTVSIQPGSSVMFMNISGDSTMTVLSGPHADDGHAHEGDTGHLPGAPVLGASETLQVEVIHVPTGEQRTMDLRPLVQDPGSYTADFVPTAPGAYTFRFFGEIEGESFDESFTSGPNTFDEVTPSQRVQFPIELRETRELQSALEGVQSDLILTDQRADDADSAASTALIVAIIGMVVGVLGFGIGGFSLVATRRKA